MGSVLENITVLLAGFLMGAVATIAAGPPTELSIQVDYIAITFPREGETSAARSPLGVPEAAVGSTPATSEDWKHAIANPQEG